MGHSTAIGNHMIERYWEVESASRMDFSYVLARAHIKGGIAGRTRGESL